MRSKETIEALQAAVKRLEEKTSQIERELAGLMAEKYAEEQAKAGAAADGTAGKQTRGAKK